MWILQPQRLNINMGPFPLSTLSPHSLNTLEMHWVLKVKHFYFFIIKLQNISKPKVQAHVSSVSWTHKNLNGVERCKRLGDESRQNIEEILTSIEINNEDNIRVLAFQASPQLDRTKLMPIPPSQSSALAWSILAPPPCSGTHCTKRKGILVHLTIQKGII